MRLNGTFLLRLPTPPWEAGSGASLNSCEGGAGTRPSLRTNPTTAEDKPLSIQMSGQPVFVFFARSQKPSHHAHRVDQNSSAETIEHVSALPRAELKSKAETNTSAPATSNRRTTSSNRRIKNTEKSENCGEPLLWFGALSLPDTHSHDWARIFRQQAPTARENSDPIVPRRSSRCSGSKTFQLHSDPGTEKKPIMPRLRDMMKRGWGDCFF